MYVNFIFISIFLGYSVGSAPIVSYHYGAGNRDELKNMFKKSTSLIAIWGILLVLLAHAIAGPLTKIFVGYDTELFALTKHGFLIYSFTYLINGFNIYGSSFFTALNNGLISALISFLRTLVFQLSAVMLLPLILGLDGYLGRDHCSGSNHLVHDALLRVLTAEEIWVSVVNTEAVRNYMK